MTGRLIVLEGGEGSGKSTQQSILVDRLRADGLTVIATHEPGGTALGVDLREWLLHRGVDERTEALLMAADRAHHVAALIRPAIANGSWVVSDRHAPSFLAYQGVARGMGVPDSEMLNAFAVGDVAPDLVLVLDVDDATAGTRLPVPTDTMEARGVDFHAAVRQAYRDLSPSRGWVVLDARGSVDDVAGRIWAQVATLLP